MKDDPQLQPYDTALKSLLEDHVAEMLPELVPDVEYIEEYPTEIVRTKLLPDQVYRVRRYGKIHLMDMELQTSADPEMAFRMLVYHVGLLEKYRLPIISIVVYPFETNVPEPVFRENSGPETLLTFDHRVLCLWQLNAEEYLHRHVVCMYTLLPAMKGVTASLLLQAIKEMRAQYPEPHLARHLMRFRTLLRRTTMLSEQDKQIVEDALYTYDSLLELDPYVHEQRDKGRTEGRQEGLQTGRIEGLQRAIVALTEVRFPTLVELVQEKVGLLDKPDDLTRLTKLIVAAPDEATARLILSTY